MFVKDKAEFEKFIVLTIDRLEYDSIFWIAYPKGTLSIKSDLNRNKLWPLIKPFGLRPVSQIAVDNDWSAMRFRPIEKVKKIKARYEETIQIFKLQLWTIQSCAKKYTFVTLG